MSIRKNFVRLWAVLSVASFFVDAACFWLNRHSPAAGPGASGLNYITMFLISAPAPIYLAAVLTILGSLLALARWTARALGRRIFRAPPGNAMTVSSPSLRIPSPRLR